MMNDLDSTTFFPVPFLCAAGKVEINLVMSSNVSHMIIDQNSCKQMNTKFGISYLE